MPSAPPEQLRTKKITNLITTTNYIENENHDPNNFQKKLFRHNFLQYKYLGF